ncbi:MAG: ZIP family metal transporter [Candidatus Falkowbacteria bacterium]
MDKSIIIIILIALVGPFLGSALGICRHYREKQVYYLLSFAAGVMAFISIFELLPNSLAHGYVFHSILGLFWGGFLMHILNIVLPHFHHPDCGQNKLKRATLFVFLGIAIHNFPEGAAIGFGAFADLKFSLVIALAIALHDIPEAICVAAPLYSVTGKKWKSFFLALLAAVPTILGFLLTYYFLGDISLKTLSLIMGFTAGVMLYISFFEIIPVVLESRLGKKYAGACFAAGALLVFFLERIMGLN